MKRWQSVTMCLVLVAANCILISCSRTQKTSEWESVEPIWQKVVLLNQEFKAKTYSNPQPSLQELYQKANANIELLNQLSGRIQAMALPSDWKSDFDRGLEANISYYKCCQNIINKRARGGQSYEELRDCARDCLDSYQKCAKEDWEALPRETFQIAAKLEGLIPYSNQITVPEPQSTSHSPRRTFTTFVTARGVGVCPDSQIRNLTESDLLGCSAWTLDIMRNEIYARHGRQFVKAKYSRYFDRQPWYETNPNYSDRLLSAVEKRNASFIKAYQEKTGLTTLD